MSDYTIGNHIGQADGSGSVYANLPDIWQKEILAAFDQEAIAHKIFMKKVIKEGHVAKFRVMGKGTAGFHGLGEDVFAHNSGEYLSDIKHDIMTVSIDRPLVAADVIDMQEMGMSGISEELRMETSLELGRSLARTYDKYILQKACMAAEVTHTLSELSEGGEITDADGRTNAQSLIDSICTALQTLDEKNVPQEDRYIFVRPAQKWLLFNDSANNASRFNLDSDIGSNGSFAKGTIGDIGGAKVVVTNHLPSTDLSSAITGDRNDYSADFQYNVALVCHKSCVGQVILDEMKVFSEEHKPTLSYRIMAHLSMGVGVLRPEAAVIINTQ